MNRTGCGNHSGSPQSRSATYAHPSVTAVTHGSSFVGKLFMSEDFQAARRATAERYRDVKVVRPEATRSHSSEVFVVAMGLRRPPPGPT